MKMTYRIIASVLILVISSSAFSQNVQIHFCDNEPIHFNFLGEAESCSKHSIFVDENDSNNVVHSCCGNRHKTDSGQSKFETQDCCKNVSLTISLIGSDEIQSELFINMNILEYPMTGHIPASLLIINKFDQKIFDPPPPLIRQNIVIQFQQFRC